MLEIEKRHDALSQPAFESLMNDPADFIHCAREGISGTYLRRTVDAFAGHPEVRALIVALLETTPGNLHRFYRRKSLSRADSEGVLDTMALIAYAQKVFGSREMALDWLQTSVPALAGEKPLCLCDTFRGRQLVRDALSSIEFGEFS